MTMPTPRDERKRLLIEFLKTIQRPDRPIEEVADDEDLIEAGLTDSLAILQIVAYLEKTYQIDFSETGIVPDEMNSINGLLDLIERHSQ